MDRPLKLAVLQPSYLPWLGYLEQIAATDIFVFYDDVQYDKNGWRNRNRIRTDAPQGWSWLTVPVRLPASFPRILDVEIDSRTSWRRKHAGALRAAYARAPHADFIEKYFGGFFEPRESERELLADVAIESVERLMRGFGIETALHRSSTLGIDGDRNTRLLNICKYFRATTYLSGAAARAYLDVGLFEREGIAVEFQDYEPAPYEQTRSPFISHLSAIDALANLGPQAGALLR